MAVACPRPKTYSSGFAIGLTRAMQLHFSRSGTFLSPPVLVLAPRYSEALEQAPEIMVWMSLPVVLLELRRETVRRDDVLR